jgi:hypothetical protein
MQPLLWIVVLAVLAVVLPGLTYWLLRPRKKALPPPLPTEWALSARPVFSTDERRVYRLLREALPHHIVLSKLPLVRFCQPTDPAEVRYWYELLGANHVAFAICSANGRVLAAIDLDTDRGNSRRLMQIKQSVLAACRVRYLRCPVDHLPTVAELQLLVPQTGVTARGPQPAPAPSQNLHTARDTLANTVAHRRAERTALWQDSTFFQDSFFGTDSRMDGLGTEFGGLTSGISHGRSTTPADPGAARGGRSAADADAGEIGGVVVDTPPRYSAPTRH